MIRNSTISANTSTGISSVWGGGPPSTLTIVNSTISGNGHDGIWACGSLTTVNSTVSKNAGSAIYRNDRDCRFTDDISDSLIDGDCVSVEPTRRAGTTSNPQATPAASISTRATW